MLPAMPVRAIAAPRIFMLPSNSATNAYAVTMATAAGNVNSARIMKACAAFNQSATNSIHWSKNFDETSHRRTVLSQYCPFPKWDLGPHLTHGFLGPLETIS